MNKNPTWQDVVELRTLLKETNIKYFFNENLFTFPWWFLLISMVAGFVLWWILLDKSKIVEILLYGFMTMTIVILLDVIGVSFILWGYPNMLLPLIPPVVAIDIAPLPLFYMVVYQHFSTWKSFFVAMTITAFIFSFVFEPICVWLGIYELNNWKHIYSFPIYIFIGIFFKWLIMKIKQRESIEQKHI